MTLANLQALTSFWPYAHSSHLGFIGVVGGGKGGNTSLSVFYGGSGGRKSHNFDVR